MKASHKIIIGYSGWMKEVLMNQSNLFSLLHFIGNSRIMGTGQDWVHKTKGMVRIMPLDGYQTGIQTIYGQLENLLDVPVEPAPDEWDRRYNLDFFIRVNDKYIGLQIKPISSGQALNQYQWIKMHEVNHKKFTDKFGGHVFFIFSVKSGNKKNIHNVEVIEKIQREIEKLKRA